MAIDRDIYNRTQSANKEQESPPGSFAYDLRNEKSRHEQAMKEQAEKQLEDEVKRIVDAFKGVCQGEARMGKRSAQWDVTQLGYYDEPVKATSNDLPRTEILRERIKNALKSEGFKEVLVTIYHQVRHYKKPYVNFFDKNKMKKMKENLYGINIKVSW
ncbi:MAG: hypothetical protein FWB98_08040 [Defluviitaleaceae bacterium]|nr:hypothetical protein [Defluviitaleaceae bacterium]